MSRDELIPSPTDWAYLAGLIDGEGCISAKPNGNGKGFRPVMTITNTNKEVLEWVIKTFGAGKLGRASTTTKPCYRIRIGKREEILRILHGCSPYLIIKFTQTQIAVELYSRPRPSPQDQYGIYRLLQDLKK